MSPSARKHRADHRGIFLHHLLHRDRQKHGKLSRKNKHPVAQILHIMEPHADAVKHLRMPIFFIAQADHPKLGDVLFQFIAALSCDHHHRVNPRLLHGNNDTADRRTVPHRQHGPNASESVSFPAATINAPVFIPAPFSPFFLYSRSPFKRISAEGAIRSQSGTASAGLCT